MKTRRNWKAEEKYQILLEANEIGVAVALRKYNICESLYYKWRRRYEEYGIDGLQVNLGNNKTDSELLKLRKENEQLKRLVADKELELQIKEELLKKTLSRKMIK